MGVFDKLRFLFSDIYLKQVCNRIRMFWRYKVARTRIRLAVVGTTSSGKSFLLKDILLSLRKMNGVPGELANTLQEYKEFGTYRPDEFGGNGGTPLYACRQGNHYGATVKHTDLVRQKYDMDFLNIPGEIFAKAKSNSEISRLDAYILLRDKLKRIGRVFTVTLWMNDNGEQKWIVEPNNSENPTAADRAARLASIDPKPLVTSFKSWEQIFSELNVGNYKPVRGSSKKISGRTILKRFFEYDTDTIIRSIQELIRKGKMLELGFDAFDFEGKLYDISFVFFHYCSLATDIVICDRIFTNDTPQKEMSFGELTQGLDAFLRNCSESGELHVYLAFRNVDFIMLPKEENYQKLNKETLGGESPSERHNAIYSIFAYAMQHYLNPGLVIEREKLPKFLGIKEAKLLAPGSPDAITPDGITDDVEKLMDALLDVSGGGGILKPGMADLLAHLNSRLDDPGQTFRMLLNRTKMKKIHTTTAVAQIIPHVYFSCTPITSEYNIYQNYIENGRTASDFKKNINGKEIFFNEQNSNVCFGTYQLTMDILTQHGLGERFKIANLLRIMQRKNI